MARSGEREPAVDGGDEHSSPSTPPQTRALPVVRSIGPEQSSAIESPQAALVGIQRATIRTDLPNDTQLAEISRTITTDVPFDRDTDQKSPDEESIETDSDEELPPFADVDAKKGPTAEDIVDVRGAVAGDSDAFGRIVDRYQADLAQQMWRFTRDPGVLAELVQEIFVQAYASLGGYHGRGPLLHWLRKLATRVGYRHWQRRAKESGHISLGDGESGPPLAVVDKEPAAWEAADLVHTLLANLPPRDRLVLTLLHLEELSLKEIAERTGWSETMVKVQAHRARKKLLKRLEAMP